MPSSNCVPLSDTKIKVSVLVTTYNHEKFIIEAINGILMQEVEFEYEIIIIEDYSTDNTRNIVIDFQERYPDKIRLVLSEKNKNDNRAWGREILNAQSQYMALLDGDDYWTCRNKLQMQVDFLDTHKECSICFHQAYNLYPDDNKILYSYDVNHEFDKSIFSLEDILVQNFIPTCSVMFRRGLFSEFPESFYDMIYPDWFLHILNAQYGKIAYINEVWGVRRVHEGGLVSMKSDKEILELRIASMEIIKNYLKSKYTEQIDNAIYSYSYKIIQLLVQEKDFKNARNYAKRYLAIVSHNRHALKIFLIMIILSGNSASIFYRLLRLFQLIHKSLKGTIPFLGNR